MRRLPPKPGKKSKDLFISIIIPVEGYTKHLREGLENLERQTYRHFEVFIASSTSFSVPFSFAQVLIDPSLAGNVSEKRNKILQQAKGSIFVFHDDDVLSTNIFPKRWSNFLRMRVFWP